MQLRNAQYYINNITMIVRTIHGTLWYCMVLCGVAWYSVVYESFAAGVSNSAGAGNGLIRHYTKTRYFMYMQVLHLS